MMATNPRTRTLCGRACSAGFLLLFALAGCKSKDGGTSNTRDPLVYGPSRIPPQNVPVPDRTGIGAKGTKSDPLLDRPVSQGSSDKAGYSADPARFTGTYIPGVGSTPAALAAKSKDDELKIDTPDNRVPLKPAGGVQPAGGIEVPGGVEPLYAELGKYGVTPESRSLTQDGEGKFVFQASVPIGNAAKRQYNGVGATANEAVKQVLDSVKEDRR